MKKITPLNGYVVLRPIETEEETFGNIIIPDLGKEKPEVGEVVCASPTYNYHSDTEIPSKLNQGDLVLIPKLGSQRITVGAEEYFITKETDILAILKQ